MAARQIVVILNLFARLKCRRAATTASVGPWRSHHFVGVARVDDEIPASESLRPFPALQAAPRS